MCLYIFRQLVMQKVSSCFKKGNPVSYKYSRVTFYHFLFFFFFQNESKLTRPSLSLTLLVFVLLSL